MRAIILALAIFAASPAYAVTADQCATMRESVTELLTFAKAVALAHAATIRRGNVLGIEIRQFGRALATLDTKKHAALVRVLNDVCPKGR
ncbi:MAG TPA: hypothetical protein ENH55_15265 [Aurantimonas coralicida]|uniref:Uncharacterized protein n=2 Tax=root TaxID=1 RepID=A0A9C9TIL1_9HYPH|nr:hypothetical protein [Aurantimonas coralicida]HEU02625.1 hypothetical protein [Aurantimonas coralicida]